MIDFGLVNKYLDKSGNHIKEGTPDKFRGITLLSASLKWYLGALTLLTEQIPMPDPWMQVISGGELHVGPIFLSNLCIRQDLSEL